MTSAPGQKPSLRVMLAYSLPMAPIYVLHVPALVLMPALYAKYGGIDLQLLGLALMLTRVFDAVTDPLVGLLSDRMRSKTGTRKHWLVAGAAIATVSAYFLFRPDAADSVYYFALASIGVYLGWTLFEIPHQAWMAELWHDYDQRTYAASVRNIFRYGGAVLFLCTPFLPIFETTEMTPEVTAFASWGVITILPLATMICVLTVPNGVAYDVARSVSVLRTFVAIGRNRPLLLLIAAIALRSLQSGMTGALYFFFVDAYLGIGDKYPHLALLGYVVGFASTPLWPRISDYIQKHRVLALSTATPIVTMVCMYFIPRGEVAIPIMMGLQLFGSIFAPTSYIGRASLMADVIDYEELSSGQNNGGMYYSFIGVLEKAGMAFGAGLAFFVAGMFDFDPQGNNTDAAISGFFLAFLGIPILLNVIATTIAMLFPITRERHADIRRRLEERAEATS